MLRDQWQSRYQYQKIGLRDLNAAPDSMEYARAKNMKPHFEDIFPIPKGPNLAIMARTIRLIKQAIKSEDMAALPPGQDEMRMLINANKIVATVGKTNRAPAFFATVVPAQKLLVINGRTMAAYKERAAEGTYQDNVNFNDPNTGKRMDIFYPDELHGWMMKQIEGIGIHPKDNENILIAGLRIRRP